jgi:hypothetical protein
MNVLIKKLITKVLLYNIIIIYTQLFCKLVLNLSEFIIDR